jgi:hypothetical protein
LITGALRPTLGTLPTWVESDFLPASTIRRSAQRERNGLSVVDKVAMVLGDGFYVLPIANATRRR